METLCTAARHLEFSGIDELEPALEDIRKPLVLLAAAGVLTEMTFSLQDTKGICGVRAMLDPYNVEDFAEMDLSRLRLLANPEACGSIEIVCQDSVFAAEITGTDWLPDATDVFSCALVSRSETDEIRESQEEEPRDADDNDDESWRESDAEGGDLYS
jgi:hypothetical protein